MLLSDAESEHNAVVKKRKNMRLKPDGPSAMRQRANKLVKKANTFHTKTPSHLYPIRRCANATEAAKGVESDALPVETTPENLIPVPQVEMDDNPEHMETPKTSPAGGTIVTRTYELMKYKCP